jgi:hypothetical protein
MERLRTLSTSAPGHPEAPDDAEAPADPAAPAATEVRGA